MPIQISRPAYLRRLRSALAHRTGSKAVTSILLDTGNLLALFHERDRHHEEAVSTNQALRGHRIVPQPVLTELFWMLNSDHIHLDARTKYTRSVEIIAQVQARFSIEQLTSDDRNRMVEIMRQYADSRFDYADAAIMAIAERLNINMICTVDRRHFSLFVPLHVRSFTLLLPETLK